VSGGVVSLSNSDPAGTPRWDPPGSTGIPARSKRRSRPDSIDRKILSLLHRDGRISKIEMSRKVALSATRCWERMRRMEREGLIRGYHADIDLGRLADLSLFVVQVRLMQGTSHHARCVHFERLIASVDVVLSCQGVLGTYDYVMTVAATGIEGFNAIMQKLSTHEGVHFEFVTFPVSKSIKTPSSIRLSALLEERD
jgi:Lrp/AsnC family transcriptional regulator of ectoine degradation